MSAPAPINPKLEPFRGKLASLVNCRGESLDLAAVIPDWDSNPEWPVYLGPMSEGAVFTKTLGRISKSSHAERTQLVIQLFEERR